MEKNRIVEEYLGFQTQKFVSVYKNIYETKRELADFIYRKIINNKEIVAIYKKLGTDLEDSSELRDMLYDLMFNDFKQFNISSKDTIHFHTKDNMSFLRMHKPDMFGDDLSSSREMVVYCNKRMSVIDGFELGKIISAYRFIYPIIIQNIHYGSIEIVFSVDTITSKIMRDYNVLSDLLLKTEILKEKLEKNEKEKYKSSLYEGYCFNKTFKSDVHRFREVEYDDLKLEEKVNREILNIVKHGEPKTVYSNKFQSTVTVIPIINNVTKKQVGFLKIREKTDYIKNVYILFSLTLIMVCLVFFFIYLYIYNQERFNKKLDREKRLVQNIIDSISNITFVTDLNRIEYANHSFLKFFHMESIGEFNQKYQDISDLFLKWEGFLYKKADQDIGGFAKLLLNTDSLRKKVMILDSEFNRKAFQVDISIIKYNSHRSYILSLTDITKHEKEKREIEKKAYYDSLTGIYNRYKFNELFSLELKKVKRYKKVFCMALIDIDHFKFFNDTYGHLSGDDILVRLTNEIQSHLRETDIFARWGGEEFIILFTNTSMKDASIACEKLRVNVEKMKLRDLPSITISFGLSSYRSGDDILSLFHRCDEALYLAKKEGRNRIEKL